MTSETGFDPALYDRFPTEGERPEGEKEQLERIWCAPKGFQYITAINNSYVGLYYLGGALLFFMLAGILALLMRTQLAMPWSGVLGQETYNQIFTMHGTVMMFLFAVPAVEAVGILMLPQMLGARDLPFPRLSAYAFWAYFLGGLAFFCSLFVGLAPNGGWFMYPPLTSSAHSPGINADFWLLGIGFIEISAIAGAIEIIVGVLRNRAPGMTLARMPVFAWTMLVFAVMVVLAFPAVILATLLLELERALGWPFFDALRGGDPLLWQHLFWFFGHPDVYIIFLPAAGMLSMVVPAVAQKRLVGHGLVVFAVLATGFISFGVWAHHMFTTGLPPLSVSIFSAASMAVAVPAGLQVFSWIGTLASGKIQWSAPALFSIGAVIIFTMGGLTGVMVGLAPFDFVVHDTYFVVAHLHYVLIGGMVFPLFAALYYWTPMVSRNRLSERWGRVAFWLMFAGVHIAFLPMHLTGLMGMPRRVFTYPESAGWQPINILSTAGAFAIAAGVLLVAIDIIRRFRFSAEDTAGNVYGGGTLEWLPSGLYSTRSIPVVKSLYPLWDDKRLEKDVEEGRYFLPNAPTGGRETIVTSTVRAEPQYLMRLPDPSWKHVAAAVFTAAFFLLLTVKLNWIAAAFGVAAIAAIVMWCWDLDRAPPIERADIGAGIVVPVYVSGPSSHGWWAMVVLLIVTGMIYAMLGFSYVYLWLQAEAWPQVGGGLPQLALCGLALAAAGAAPVLLKRAGGWAAAAAITASAALMTGGWWLDLSLWRTLLSPRESAHDALVAAFLSFQGLCVFTAVLMAGFVVARRIAGLLPPARPATVECVSLFLAYTAAQGAVSVALTRLAPLLG